MQLLKEALPKASRIAVLFHPANAAHPPLMRVREAAAKSLSIQLQPVEVRGPEDFARAFSAMVKEKADAFQVIADMVSWTHRAQIVELALRHRLPGMGFAPDDGLLLSYQPDVTGLCGRVAHHADKILKGASPGDIPLEQPTKFVLGINLKIAKALGITIPPSLLQRADRVIE